MELTVNSNVAESSGAIVLHIRVGRVQEANKNRNGSRVDELLSVLI